MTLCLGCPPGITVSLNLASAGFGSCPFRNANMAEQGKGKQEIKVSLISLQEGLWCITWFHNGPTPSLSVKQGKMNLTCRCSVCIYIYIYIYICACGQKHCDIPHFQED